MTDDPAGTDPADGDRPHLSDGADEGVPPRVRPALDVPPLAAWWIVAAGIAGTLLLVVTDHVLRATVVCGATLVLGAVLRLALSPARAGGLVVRGRFVDALILLLLAGLVLLSGFTLDLSPR